MRNIKYIAVHCTACSPTATVKSILNYWKNVKKWLVVGYHFLVEADGNINYLLPVSAVSNGVLGFNHCTINVCYIGGIDKAGNPTDTRTDKQKASLLSILKKLKSDYPEAEILGHKDFPNVAKACPSFEAKLEYSTL